MKASEKDGRKSVERSAGFRPEPDNTTWLRLRAQAHGEDVAESWFTRPACSPWNATFVCTHCETLVQAPGAPHIIDKGSPTTGLLAQLLMASTSIIGRCTELSETSSLERDLERRAVLGPGLTVVVDPGRFDVGVAEPLLDRFPSCL